MFFDFNDFSFPVTFSFSRPFYESAGYFAVEKDGKLFIVINVLGVNKNDLEVTVENDPDRFGRQLLSVRGKSHNDLLEKDFSIVWKRSVSKPIESVDYTVENGLLTLEVEFKEPIKPQVRISSK